jgi:hypothetical protein
MAHYQSAKRVKGTLSDLENEYYDYEAPDDELGDKFPEFPLRVEVRTKELGTAEFDLIAVMTGQMSTAYLEADDGTELKVQVNQSPRGKFDSPARLQRLDATPCEGMPEWEQVMEITVLDE